ncbi:carbohydrate ABC transporter permease [Lichenifustis flavocetrariae]|uniref:Sugar ABC transporter permease n=1 Tax=Lichenifustis flavocetrariae TaxID=2949735 RepID=A0AA41YUV6_9HYPH|nr:sugar ABC transporter permease [Lichenifustis flavocetrariae]MCW6507477.1 sugar ABC transporter permease [Lichenifustis flavocetrariae]
MRLSVFDTFRDGRGLDALLVLLTLVYLIVFGLAPILYTVLMSLQQVDMFTLGDFSRPFVGFANYVDVLTRPEAGMVARHTLVFVALSVACQLVLGFALALFFQQDFPGAGIMRGLFLAAWIMPGLVVGGIWRWMLAGDNGVVNSLLAVTHLHPTKIFWMSDPATSLYAVTIANIWLGIPFNMLLLSVGLAAIPKDLYEAAQLDGAGPVERFRSITLPMMRATLGALVSLSVIFTLQQFDLFAGMTQGGPSNSSNVAQFWSWQLSFQTYDIAGGSTIAVLMIAVVIGVATLYVRSTRHEQIG